jgi:hypothetical protein
MFRTPPPPEKLAERVAKALIEHMSNYPGDSHFFTLTALGATSRLLPNQCCLINLRTRTHSEEKLVCKD